MKRPIAIITSENYHIARYEKDTIYKVLNENILFDNCFDVSAYYSRGLDKRFKFVNAETVFFKGCNKNFPFFVFYPHNFPKVKNVVFCSHPCERYIFYRFDNVSYWLDNQFSQYLPYDIPIKLCSNDTVLQSLSENFQVESIIRD